MKKICFIVSSPLTASSFLKGPINKLSRVYEIYLIVNLNNKHNKLIDKLNVKKVFHFEIVRNISVFRDIICLIKMTYFFRKNKFHAIHSVSPKAGLIAMLGGYISGVEVRIHTFTGQVWVTKKGVIKNILKFIDKLISELSTIILTDGKSQLDFLIKNKIVDKKAKVLGKGSISGVSLKKFNPNYGLREKLRRKFNVIENQWVFMYLGRLKKDKGIIDLIEAFLKIKKEKNTVLFLVGDDEENLKKNYMSEPRILFLPHNNKPENIIQICDTFCLPSYREGFGLSVIEASSLKKPIISSDIYGLKDTVINKKTGLVFQAGDTEKLTDLLIYAINNKKKMKEMGGNGRDYVEKNFSEKNILTEWKRFYSENVC